MGNSPDVTMIFGGLHGNEAATVGVVRSLYAYLDEHPGLRQSNGVILAADATLDGVADRARANAAGVGLNRNFPAAIHAALC
jgi:predicted deacylase